MTIHFSIGGQDTPAASGKTFVRKDPVTGKDATTAAAMGQDDIAPLMKAAVEGAGAWGKMGPNDRRRILNKAAELMEARADDFIAAMITETGATKPWAGFNVGLGAGHIREAAALTTQVGGRTIPSDKPGTLAMSVRVPKGVCLAIAPWNAPVILAARAVASPLACGNAVILKASEMCPAVHRLLIDCFVDAGVPAGAVNYVSNAPEDAADVVKALIEAPEVRHVNFTGSSKVGRVIGRLAGENLKPALLELGGKAPLVILDDADLDGAVNAAIFGAFMNQGQICMSTERIIVDDRIADDFAKRLADRASALPWGDPRDQVVLGSLVTPDAGEKMDALIKDATQKGAKVIAGGDRKGAMVAATLLDGVTADMRVYAEESFGPVKPIIRVSGDDAAVAVANDTEYGLSAAVFSQDISRALSVANRIHSGIVHINGPTLNDEPQMPFGGVGASGFGRFGGTEVIHEFTDLRWITIEDPNQHYPF
ncbi:MAG: salicylaldehyde dehydrogenase [Paracoccus denitrificans]|nr:MAG: salicylaldehyde dehydrogenase [Paracoccus denitrificans]PZO85030.1 MAG: salicylaldehyde dehydrogenase [Paracoccus denitrificans]